MKKALIIFLFFVLGCNQDTSTTPGDVSVPSETSSPDGTVPSVGPSVEPATNPDSPSAVVNQTLTEEFMDLVNDHRASIGLRALIHVDELGDIARIHSENMANGTTPFGHTGFSERCAKARTILGGGNWCGENVAAGQKTPQAAYTSWMNSSGHRANIESSKATHTGFGYAKSPSGKFYWTQIFLQR